MRISRWTGSRVGWFVAAVLVGAAVVDQLRRPAPERTWSGTLAGVVPYDLRPPTPTRVAEEFWSPHDPHLLRPHAFGVGWGPNLGRLAHLAGLVP